VTLDYVARAQISVQVTQDDVAGDQTDIELEQIWDLTIRDEGANLQKAFTRWDGNCGASDELQRRGATAQSIGAWESACKQTLTERAKFESIFKRIMDQRAMLKSFEITAQAHRKALVEQATRTE
jgi:hypothetical protein